MNERVRIETETLVDEGADPGGLGPLLLPPLAGGEARIDHDWRPVAIALPRTRRGALAWLGWGAGLLGATWIGSDLATVITAQLDRGGVLGWLALAGLGAAGACLAAGIAIEARGLARLHAVDRLRALLADESGEALEDARAASLRWLRGLPEADAADEAAVRAAASVAGLRAALSARVLPALREQARAAGVRAAIEGGALVAVLPSDVLDGLAGAWRGWALVRRIAAIYGLRPGPLVLIALLRRIAWTAAAIAGTQFFVQTLTDHALRELPVFRHLARASGMSVAAYRLYRLAAVTAEACAPITAAGAVART